MTQIMPYFLLAYGGAGSQEGNGWYAYPAASRTGYAFAKGTATPKAQC